MLGGCGESYYYGDGCCGAPVWLDVASWAKNTFVAGLEGHANRTSKEASEYAFALYTLKRYKDLLKHTSKWLMWDPSNPEAYEQCGKAALHLGDTKKAIRAFSSHAEIW